MPTNSAATGEQSPSERPRPGARPPNLASRVGTGREVVPGEDLRSSASRRLRELLDEYGAPWGGWAALQASDELAPVRRTVKRAALLAREIERLGAEAAPDRTSLAALNNQLTRLEDRLERAAAAKPKAPGQLFDEHMARLAREEAS